MSSNTPYRGLLDSSNFPREADMEKENFESFKQKKFKEIEQARGMKDSMDQKRKSILKPTTLNLKSLRPVQRGPPTFDSEYEFRNIIINDNHVQESKSEEIEFSLRLNSITKQYETKIKTQAERYELEIMKLNQKIQTLIHASHAESERKNNQKQYCHLCSNGQVINGLNKMMKGLEEAHKNCIVLETESSKKIMTLEKIISDCKDNISNLTAEKNILSGRLNSYEEQIKVLNEELFKQKQRQIHQKKIEKPEQPVYNHGASINYDEQRLNLRRGGMSNPYERSSLQSKTRPSSSIVLEPSKTKRQSIPGFLFEEFKTRKTTGVETYQSEHAAKIIERVKSNSLMGGGPVNPRTKAQQKKYNYA